MTTVACVYPTNPTNEQLLPPWDQIISLFDEGRIEDAVVCYVRETGRVGFRELAKLLSGTIPTDGDFSLAVKSNVIIWRGISREFAEFVKAILGGGQLCLQATVHPALHEGYLGLRTAKFPLRREYSRLRHLPVVFCLPERLRLEHNIDPADVTIVCGVQQ